MLLCAAAPEPKGRPRKRILTGVANRVTKRRTYCRRCASLDNNVPSFPQKEVYIIPIPPYPITLAPKPVTADPNVTSANIKIPIPSVISDDEGVILVSSTGVVKTDAAVALPDETENNV